MAHETTVNFATQLANGDLDWANDDIRILLAGSLSAITAESLTLGAAAIGEVAGTGYSRLTVPGRSIDPAGAGGNVRFNATKVQWGALTLDQAVTKAIVYKHAASGLDANHVPLVILDLGAVNVPAADTFSIDFPSTGAARVKYGAL